MISTFSYVAIKFFLGLNMVDMLNSLVYVTTPLGDFVTVTQVYHNFFVMFIGFQTWVD